jgi:diadenosine tetraphosphatase ApaH/serine/threonine PP2A family protein phosphatase
MTRTGGSRLADSIALISDIHANLEALTTVLADIDRRGIKRIVCLGDIIGYGPNPRECLDIIIDRCEWALMGNHDYAVMYEPTNFNAGAEAAAFWTRRQFELEPDAARRNRWWKFLGGLQIRQFFGNDLMAVHGSPRRPINEYVFADDVTTAPTKMQQIFDRVERACFVGHTHVQGVFTDEPDFYAPAELGNKYEFDERERVVINVGSVGQPRDRDPRSAYTILHGDEGVEFVRIEYDIKAVVRKVEAIPDLNDFFGHRLLEGR